MTNMWSVGQVCHIRKVHEKHSHEKALSDSKRGWMKSNQIRNTSNLSHCFKSNRVPQVLYIMSSVHVNCPIDESIQLVRIWGAGSSPTSLGSPAVSQVARSMPCSITLGIFCIGLHCYCLYVGQLPCHMVRVYKSSENTRTLLLLLKPLLAIVMSCRCCSLCSVLHALSPGILGAGHW